MGQMSAFDARTQGPSALVQDAARSTTAVAAAAAAASAADACTSPSRQTAVTVAIPPRDAAQNDDLIAHLTEIVNRIYLEAEGSFWKPGFKRTNAAEIKACLSSGNLALAWLGEASYHNHANLKTDLVGCANIKMSPEEETGEFGMLACDTAARGRGVGRELLRFAEDETLRRGARRMLLTLLQGDGWRHEFKARLEAWYGRNGYQLVRVEDVRTNWAFLAPLLAKPMVMKVFIKDL